MLGIGEEKNEVIQTMKDLVGIGCDVITIGQYLQPTKKHLAVQRFVHPDEFAELRTIGYELGFLICCSAGTMGSSCMLVCYQLQKYKS